MWTGSDLDFRIEPLRFTVCLYWYAE